MDSIISKPERKSVIDLTQESVHTNDNKDIGDIEAMNKDFIVVKRGFRDVHYYYIPIIAATVILIASNGISLIDGLFSSDGL